MQDEKCRFKTASVGANDTGYVDIKSKSESDLQTAVATVGPISVAIDAAGSHFQVRLPPTSRLLSLLVCLVVTRGWRGWSLTLA